MRTIALGISVLLGFAFACDDGLRGLNDADRVSGTIYAANGTDPIAGATVFVPSTSAANRSAVEKKRPSRIRGLSASDGTSCSDPTESSCAQTCSAADGSFVVDTTNCTGAESNLKVVKGIFQKTIALNCQEKACVLSKEDATFSGNAGGTDSAKMAVVTGAWDRMQDVLAKLGYGSVGENGNVVAGSEQFTIFCGASCAESSQYQSFDKILDGTVDMSQFDIIFINCGNDYEDLLTDASEGTAVRKRIRDYVTNGGKLYVTDLSYDFVEQVFPEVMKFENDPDSSTAPGLPGYAQKGMNGVEVDAMVLDNTMKKWLEQVSVNSGTTMALCDPLTLQVNGKTNALNADGTVHIADFLDGWARMVDKHSDQDPTIWVRGTIDAADRPLTITMEIGDKGGKVLYSSYHTSEGCPTKGFWPQERILQYLVFEM